MLRLLPLNGEIKMCVSQYNHTVRSTIASVCPSVCTSVCLWCCALWRSGSV